MGKPMKTPILSAAVVAALMLAGAPAQAAPRIGQPAPPLQTTLLDGRTFDLGQARGKVVIVSLWATWCTPCRLEMPILDQARTRYGAEGLEVVGLSADRPKSREDVARVMQSVGYPTGMALETKMNGFGVPRALPQTFVIDRQGVVRAEFGVLGDPVTEARLEAVLGPLLAVTR